MQLNCYRWWQNYTGLAVNNTHCKIQFLLQTYNPLKAQGLYSAAAFILKVLHTPYADYLPCTFLTFFFFFFRMTVIIFLNSINGFGLCNEDTVCFMSWELNFQVALIRILSFKGLNFSKLKSNSLNIYKNLSQLSVTYHSAPVIMEI
jgi:hypothetical protein